MPDPAPPGPAPASPAGASKGPLPTQPPLPPWRREPYFWYGVLVLGVSFFGVLMGWKMPDIDRPFSGGGYSSGGRWSFGGK